MEAFQREIFEKSVDISLTKVVNTWLRTDSHPMVTASVDVQRNELLISQEQLLPQNVSGVQRPVVLPITIRGESNNGSDRIFFIVTNTVATKASDFIGNDTWLLLNPHGTGKWYIFVTGAPYHLMKTVYFLLAKATIAQITHPKIGRQLSIRCAIMPRPSISWASLHSSMMHSIWLEMAT